MKKLKVTQIKSAIGYEKSQKDTIKALKLGKLHRTVVFDDTPQMRGMIRKVKHLLHVEEIG